MTNSKLTKRALLSSVMALILCFTMLLGTTFAWFTDTASTSVNKIEAGTLDIQLLDASDNSSLEGKTLSWQKAAGHENEDVLWEPGCTYSLQPITIKNNGSLALKYKIAITGIKGDAKLNEVIEWTIKVGETDYAADNEFHLEAEDDHTLTISGHMKDSASNEYQGLSIDGISITVYATQDTVEYDSTSNRYDANATYDIPWDGTTTAVSKNAEDGKYHITSASEFAWMMAQTNGLASIYSNEQIVLDCNVDFGGATIIGFGKETVKFGGSFDGQGHTVSNFIIDRSDRDDYAGLFNYYSYGTIENLNVKNATVIGQSKVGALLGSIDDGATVKNCTVENCIVVADRKVGGAIGYAQGAAVNNITVKNTTVYCGTTEQAYGKDQWGKVIGYKNTGYSESGNVAGEDVVVINGTTYIANGVAQQGNTYLISNASGLQWFANQVNENYNGFNGKTIKLTADIDLNNAEWYPIGQNENLNGHMQEFFGIFDGAGHTIKNLKIKSHTPVEIRGASSYTTDDNMSYGVGFFGWLSGAVKNVTFENVKVSGYNYVGVVAGYFQYTGSGDVIENCIVKNCEVVATHVDDTFCGAKVGGIVGMIGAENGAVKNCKVENTNITAGRDAGQVVGCTQSGTIVENCIATNVTVTAGGDCNGTNISNAIVGRDLR